MEHYLLRAGAYSLPYTPQTLEHFEWLAVAIRKFKGQASVLRVQSLGDCSDDELKRNFVDARSRDYEQLQSDLKKVLKCAKPPAAALGRIRKRFSEVSAIDFFNSPVRSRLEAMLAHTERMDNPLSKRQRSAQRSRKEYLNRTWITRPRPGIDRVRPRG